MPIPTIYSKDRKVFILDQTLLPLEKKYIQIKDEKEMWEAIKKLRIRGAPAIGIAAAFGIWLGIKDFKGDEIKKFLKRFNDVCDYLATSRPTAVNLFWAIDRIKNLVNKNLELKPEELKDIIFEEANLMIEEDNNVCRAIGCHGVRLIKDGDSLITHCNAGGLATAMYGTALAPMYRAKELGYNIHVWVDETRPLLQGARITAFELVEAKIPATLITDNMAAFVMYQGKVNLAIVGADRIAANGDTANKIGTLALAILSSEFNVPFYIAAPLSTIDLNKSSGEDIPIEERNPDEVIRGFGKQTAPSNIKVYNPAFDVTPARYITGIITEKGIIHPPFEENIKKIF
ncbi:MAG: S-methyl-5-thioribose-1-phosphate isomerase [Spirochaetes bacterium]|nr:MAG: S-methyl-5-thioribose-1-phosphate isomerase [Spirochaetota bacterium]